MNNLVLVLDMDEVVVDFSQYIIEQYNKDFKDNMAVEDNKSYWWADCPKASKPYFENLLLKKGTFLKPKATKDAIKIINKLYGEGFKIIFCTYPQYNSDYCIKEKILWLQKHLFWFDTNEHIVFTGNKGLLAQSNTLLLDDNLIHIKDFINNGGIGCVFEQNWNRKNSSYHSVKTFEEFYEFVHEIDRCRNNTKGNKYIL